MTKRVSVPSEKAILSYLAYLEEIATIAPIKELAGPDGEPIQPLPGILEQRFVRARFSGVSEERFYAAAMQIDTFSHHDLSTEQRASRKAALIKAFESLPLPIIDLFWATTDKKMQTQRRRLRLNRWVRIKVAQGNATQATRPVFMGEPEPGRPVDEAFISGHLVKIGSVGDLEWLLREIFSLKHVEDWNVRDLPPGPSQPPPPDSGSSGGALANLLVEDAVAGASRLPLGLSDEEWHDQEVYMENARGMVFL